MDVHGRWLRERPPLWPPRDEDFGPGPRRWEREPEPFEDDALPELYPGSLVIEDLVVTDDEVSTLRVLARYTVLRVLLLSACGRLRGGRLRVERRVALEHLALLPAHDWERRSLERLTMLCREELDPEIIAATIVAAEAAAKRSQVMGAFALYRAAYDLSCREAWWSEAAHSASGIARLARLEEARYSVRLWERRARVLDRRADRADRAGTPDSPGP